MTFPGRNDSGVWCGHGRFIQFIIKPPSMLIDWPVM
jgi:hypothetical protein